MDRNGDAWTGDQTEAEAHGESAPAGDGGNQAVAGRSKEERAPLQRSVDTAAEELGRLNDNGETPTPTGGGGSAGESN